MTITFDEFLLDDSKNTYRPDDRVFVKEEYNEDVFFLLFNPFHKRDKFSRIGVFCKKTSELFLNETKYISNFDPFVKNALNSNLAKYYPNIESLIKNVSIEISKYADNYIQNHFQPSEEKEAFKHYKEIAIENYVKGSTESSSFLWVRKVNIDYEKLAKYLTNSKQAIQQIFENEYLENFPDRWCKFAKDYLYMKQYFHALCTSENEYTLNHNMYSALTGKSVVDNNIVNVVVHYKDGSSEKRRIVYLTAYLLKWQKSYYLEQSFADISKITHRKTVLWDAQGEKNAKK